MRFSPSDSRECDPIDPGEHTFGFQVAGQADVTKTLLIQQAQKDRRELIPFGSRSLCRRVPTPEAASRVTRRRPLPL